LESFEKNKEKLVSWL